MSDEEKIMVNGKEEEPLNKVSLAPGFDWEEIAREKQKEDDEE